MFKKLVSCTDRIFYKKLILIYLTPFLSYSATAQLLPFIHTVKCKNIPDDTTKYEMGFSRLYIPGGVNRAIYRVTKGGVEVSIFKGAYEYKKDMSDNSSKLAVMDPFDFLRPVASKISGAVDEEQYLFGGNVDDGTGTILRFKKGAVIGKGYLIKGEGKPLIEVSCEREGNLSK